MKTILFADQQMNFMENSNLVSLGFLVFGGFFVYALLTGLWKLISTDWKVQKFSVVKVFGPTIVSLILLFVFISLVLPKVQ